MKSYSLSNRKSVWAARIVCSLFFGIFSLIYLGMFQEPLLSYRADILFSGNLQYNPWIGAALITLLLWLVQRLVVTFVRFGQKSYAFSFTPSFILLGAITYFPENYTFPLAVCIVAGALALSLALFSVLGRKSTKLSVANHINFGLQELMLLSCLTVAIGNTDEDLHHELSMLQAMQRGDNAKVLQVGKNSLSVSSRMADYRIRALIATKQLGDLLFEYPQYYNSLPVLSTTGISGSGAFERDMARKLLNKDLKGIVGKMERYSSAQIPKHYEEALALYTYLNPGLNLKIDNENINGRLQSFMDLRELIKSEKDSPAAEKSKIRREFGTTYWYYYYYSEK